MKQKILQAITVSGCRRVRRQKSQALSELAVFSAILLFVVGIFLQYGMRLNQQQYFNMRAFRRVLWEAYNSNTSLPLQSQSRNVLAVSAQSTPVIDSPFAIPQREQISYSPPAIIWSQNLKSESEVEWGNYDHLPTMRFQVYKYLFTPKEYVFYTAGFNEIVWPPDFIIMSISQQGTEKKAQLIYTEITASFEDADRLYDLDNDLLDEEIIEIEKNSDGRIVFKYLDDREGEIDVNRITTWIADKKVKKEAKFTRTEDAGGITTTVTWQDKDSQELLTKETFEFPVYINKAWISNSKKYDTSHLKNQVRPEDWLDENNGILYIRQDYRPPGTGYEEYKTPR